MGHSPGFKQFVRQRRREMRNKDFVLEPHDARVTGPGAGYVYIMSYPNSDKVKIGHTNNPSLRVSQIGGTLAPEMPRIEILFWCSERREDVERRTHSYHQSKRRNGEWFELPVEEAMQTIEKVAAWIKVEVSLVYDEAGYSIKKKRQLLEHERQSLQIKLGYLQREKQAIFEQEKADDLAFENYQEPEENKAITVGQFIAQREENTSGSFWFAAIPITFLVGGFLIFASAKSVMPEKSVPQVGSQGLYKGAVQVQTVKPWEEYKPTLQVQTAKPVPQIQTAKPGPQVQTIKSQAKLKSEDNYSDLKCEALLSQINRDTKWAKQGFVRYAENADKGMSEYKKFCIKHNPNYVLTNNKLSLEQYAQILDSQGRTLEQKQKLLQSEQDFANRVRP